MAAASQPQAGSSTRNDSVAGGMASAGDNKAEKNKNSMIMTPIPSQFTSNWGHSRIASKEDFKAWSRFVNKPLRRPHSWKPPPLPMAFFSPPVVPENLSLPDDPQLARFFHIFSGEPLTETQVFLLIDDFVFYSSEGPHDIRKMVIYLIDMSMECAVNVVSIFKAMYIITQNSVVGATIRALIFEEVELRFKTRIEKIFRGPDGSRRFRNFVKFMMALVHHYRNLNKAPIHDLVDALYHLAVDLSHFRFFDDVPIYVTLMLRVHYYSALPRATKEDSLPNIRRAHKTWCKKVLEQARATARVKLSSDPELPPSYRKWLMLLLEARGSPNIYKDEDLVRLYKNLPGFEKLTPDELMIKLPHNFERGDFNIFHISKYVTYEETPAVTEPSLVNAVQEEIPAAVASALVMN